MKTKIRHSFLLLGVILLFASITFSQPANIYTFEPDVRITDVPVEELGTSSVWRNSGQHYTGFRGDTVYVVWWESRSSTPPTGNHVFFAKSTDGGATFGPSKRVNDIAAAFNPVMRMDSSGVIYVAYERQRNIYFTKSTDGGNTFSPSLMVVDASDSGATQQYPALAVNNKGHVFIAWSDGRTGSSTIFTTASYSGGQSFEPNVQVDPGARGPKDIATDDEGRVYVAYNGNPVGYVDGIIVARSTDSGRSFSYFAQAVLDSETAVFGHSLAVSQDGRVGVAFERGLDQQNAIRFSVSSDFGLTFSPSVRVDTGYSEQDCTAGGAPSLCSSNGIFYVAWDDCRSDSVNSIFYSGVFLSYSTNQGNSFAHEAVKDVSNGAFYFYNTASVAVNEKGKAFVAWITDREDPAFQIAWRIYGAAATPNFVKGDLNLDGLITSVDAVLELNAVYLDQSYPAPFESADSNCDTRLTGVDAVLHLMATFLGNPFPC